VASEGADDSSKEERVLEWWKDPSERPKARGRPLKHYGRKAERHRSAQAAYARKRRWALLSAPERLKDWRSKRAAYMRRYRAENPAYAQADNNRRRQSQRIGTGVLVPSELGGLTLSPSTLRALTARSVDYGSPKIRQLLEEQPELAMQVLARYALGAALIAKAGSLGLLMAGSVFSTLPGATGGRRRRGRKSTFDTEWQMTFSPIVPLDAKPVPTERCETCRGTSFAEDFGRGERFCLGCGAVVGSGPRPRLVGEHSPSSREH
jgi:hypothetical protein